MATESHQHEACYIFSPESGRPAKRRRTSKPAAVPTASDAPLFIKLLDGTESTASVKRRYDTFKKLWGEQESGINDILHRVNAHTLDWVISFVQRTHISLQDGKIPTGLVVTGPNIASHRLLFSQIATRVQSDPEGIFVQLTSAENVNLKASLKAVIKKAVNQVGDRDQEDEDQNPQKRKLLDYDLRILHDHVEKHHIRRVVVAFQDSEAIDGGLLTEFICLLSSWLDRIPFVLLFGIATSVDIFQERLSHSAIRYIEGQKFDVEQGDRTLETLFNHACGSGSRLRPGPVLRTMLWDRNEVHSQSVQTFVSKLKYLYMSHFYANPLSVLLADISPDESLEPRHYEAIRHLPSFRRLVERSLDDGDTQTARVLLDDDDFLHTKILEHTSHCQESAIHMLHAIFVLHSIASVSSDVFLSDLYIKAVSGTLLDSPVLRNALLAVKKMHSGSLTTLLDQVSSKLLDNSTFQTELAAIQGELVSLVRSDNNAVIRSGHDTQKQTLRTTVIAQKVALSKRQAELSESETSYTKLVDQAYDLLKSYFEATIIFPQELFLHEVFYYDLRSPHREVFSPRPRFAIERALSAPHDYLGCSCCGGTSAEGGLSSTQPPTAILYQLYLESGALINVFDLWSAFYAIVGGGEDGQGCDERHALALFYRALADLKFLGMVRHSRKRPDHIAKLAWKGL
ncbi:MAG: hypothetical protein M1816_002082 [Peltula sp. TS41687]|nr:MAG: hypothetical protein M1816_002082 [Peltula sp. TS41687]